MAQIGMKREVNLWAYQLTSGMLKHRMPIKCDKIGPINVIKLSKRVDYGIVLLKHLSRSSECHSASLLAKSTKISLPHVRKILQLLHKAGFLVAKKGGQGGYSLSMPVENMSILAIVEAIDGPVLLTSCVDHSPCHIEGACQLSDHWRSVNMQVKSLLGQINLATMFEPIPPAVHEQSVPLNQIKRLRYV